MTRYQDIMGDDRRRKRFSLGRLVCSSIKDRKDYYEDDDGVGDRSGPLAFALDRTRDNDSNVFNPPFEDLYNGVLNLDDSVSGENVLGESVAASKDYSICTNTTTTTSSSSVGNRSSGNNSSAAFAKRWRGDGGDDQPANALRFPDQRRQPSRMHGSKQVSKRTASSRQKSGGSVTPPLPSFVDSRNLEESPVSTRSPDSVMDSLGFEAASMTDTSLIRRVEMIKARAESILMEAHKKQSVKNPKQSRSGESIKSFASSIKTEPTVDAAVSASSSSRGSFADKISRLQRTKKKLQQIADDYSDTSSLNSGSVQEQWMRDRMKQSYSYRNANESSILDMSHESSDSVTVPGGSKSMAESPDVLHIISMLEAINGYNLTVGDAEETLDSSNLEELNFSFLR